MNLYTIYDKVALEFGPIFEAKNDDVAKRAVTQLLDKADPADYQLFLLGEFEHEQNVSDQDFSLIKMITPTMREVR